MGIRTRIHASSSRRPRPSRESIFVCFSLSLSSEGSMHARTRAYTRNRGGHVRNAMTSGGSPRALTAVRCAAPIRTGSYMEGTACASHLLDHYLSLSRYI